MGGFLLGFGCAKHCVSLQLSRVERFCNAACSDLGLSHMNIATQSLYLIPSCQTLLPLLVCNWVVSSTKLRQ